jgi:hypothetical protein
MCFGTSSGKLSQLAHYGPLGAISLILWMYVRLLFVKSNYTFFFFKCRTISAFHCLIQWYPPDHKDPLSVINFLIFWLWPVVIFYNYFRAVFVGPGIYLYREKKFFLFVLVFFIGFVPKGWKPVNQEHEKFLQYCKI